MLTELISDYAVKILESTGYLGAAFLMALESMIFPIPSEAVMPFVGFLVADGRWQLAPAVLATTAGSLLGSLASYALGFYGGKAAVDSIGKYLLLNSHDLAWAERFFSGRNGALAVLMARFIPIVRHVISIPAGVGRMPLGAFLLVTAVGATLWNGFLLYCGLRLREHWATVHAYGHRIDLGMGVVLLLVLAFYLKSRLGQRRDA